MIEIEHLHKRYVANDASSEALSDISLSISEGDIFGIIGVSGAGKSTLVRCINLLERPTSGRVVIDGTDVTSYKGRALRDLRANIGMVFQDFNLLSQRTVLQNVTLPLRIRGLNKAERRARGLELLEIVGLSEYADRYPSQLSGGQQQRVSIARALADRPHILLCDEATSALDTLTTNSILKLLRDINRKLGVTIVVITHSMSVVEKICNRVAVIDENHILEQGNTEEIFAEPKHLVTRQLLGMVSWDV